MKRLLRLLLVTALIPCLVPPATASEDEIRALALQWAEGIGMGDADYMAAFYAEDAILHGTVSPVLRIGHGLIREYFAGIEDNPPEQFFVEPMHIRVFDDVAVNTGNYGVRLAPDAEPIMLRYSFVYRKIAGEWKIIDHHSSTMPE